MNPQQDQPPGLRLPQPSFGSGEAAPYPYSPTTVASGGTQVSAMPRPMLPVDTLASQPEVASSQQSAGSAASADDENGLDQEWIAKAQDIVRRTHGDPYVQSQELGNIKAQYMKVRYNKDIKMVEDQ